MAFGVDVRVAPATGQAERDEALEMLRRLRRRRGHDPKTLAGDKGYCLGDFPQRVLDLGIKPHLAGTRQRACSLTSKALCP